MRYLIIPAVVAASTGLGMAAFAAEHTSGEVASIDRPALTLSLADGNVYRFSNRQQVAGLRPGDEVLVTWDQNGGMRFAKFIQAYKPHDNDND